MAKHRTLAATILVPVIGIVLASCSTNRRGRASTQDVATKVRWLACKDPESQKVKGLECGTFKVPADYDRPKGTLLTLAVVRLRATSATQRIGSLLTNPGGPGGSGIEFARNASTILPLALRERFDLIGLDPRGVADSAPIKCATAAELDNVSALDPSPDTPAESRLVRSENRRLNLKCAAVLRKRATDFSTEAAARDLDVLRAALGDDRITYLGISYGTNLGGVYATLFPNRVRSLVLDGAFDPAGDDPAELLVTQLRGFENEFTKWATWCDETKSACPFSGDAAAKWDRLLNQFDAKPVKIGPRTFGEGYYILATIAALYSRGQWGTLGAALERAQQGDVRLLTGLADDYIGRKADGTWKNIGEANSVITCASGFKSQAGKLVNNNTAIALMKREAPRFSRLQIASIDDELRARNCTELGVNGTAVVPSYRGRGPVLVIGGTGDPATPLRWASELQGRLGPAAKLLVWEGDGHAAFAANSCATDAIASFLIDPAKKVPGRCKPNDPSVVRKVAAKLPTAKGDKDVEVGAGIALLAVDTSTSAVRTIAGADGNATVDAIDGALRADGWVRRNREEQNGLVQTTWNKGASNAIALQVPKAIVANVPEFATVSPSVPAAGALVILIIQ